MLLPWLSLGCSLYIHARLGCAGLVTSTTVRRADLALLSETVRSREASLDQAVTWHSVLLQMPR